MEKEPLEPKEENEKEGVAFADVPAGYDWNDVFAIDQPKKGADATETTQKAVERINSCSAKEYAKLLEVLERNSQKSQVPQEIVSAILEKGLYLYEQQPEGQRDTSFLMNLSFAFQPGGSIVERVSDEGNVADKAFRAFVHLAPKHPQSAREFSSALGQMVIRPDVFVDGVVDIISQPGVPQELKEGLVHDFNGRLVYGEKGFIEAMQSHLNFDDPASYFRTGVFLEFLRRLHGVSDWWLFSKKKSAEIPRLIKEAIDKNKGSYLLHSRAREIYESMQKGDTLESGESPVLIFPDQHTRHAEELPFRLSTDRYAIEFDGELHVSDTKDKAELDNLLEKFEQQKEMIAAAKSAFEEKVEQFASGEREAYIQAQQELEDLFDAIKQSPDYYKNLAMPEEYENKRMEVQEKEIIFQEKVNDAAWKEYAEWEKARRRARAMLKQMYGFFQKKLAIGDLALKRRDKTPEEQTQNQQDLYDYSYLVEAGGMREIVEKEFGIKIGDLSLQEQFYFLQFIKNKEANEIEPVKQFVQKYGLDGLKTFLSVDYGKEFGDKIVELGETLEEKDATEIFAEFAEIIDRAQSLIDNIKKTPAAENLPILTELRENLPAELYEALVRRAKDLLVAAHILGVEQKEPAVQTNPESPPLRSPLNLESVKDALYGLSTMLKVLNSFENDDEFIVETDSQKQTSSAGFRFKARRKITGEEYVLKTFVRPRETERGQARINFELRSRGKNADSRFERAFAQKTAYKKQRRTVSDSVLRVGIDRDTYGGQEALSLDFGRNYYQGEKFDRTGDILGNLLEFASESGHHTTAAFDTRYADKEIFRAIAGAFQIYLRHKSSALATLEENSK